MIRNPFLVLMMSFALVSCATKAGFQTTQTYEAASFQVSDVYVNMINGIENSERVRRSMLIAGVNTADIYNEAMASGNSNYPLEIEVNEVNFRKPKAPVNAEEQTFIKYTAILREAETGEVFRTMPVTYYHASTSAITTPEAKRLAENDMIRISMKNAFARLYGLEEVPHTVQTYFSTNDILADPDAIADEPVARSVQSSPTPVADPVIVESDTSGDEPLVIKCVVC